jgi:hypothetical protein
MRRHELLKACGFEKSRVEELTTDETQWKNTFDRLAETAPEQTWAPMFAALCTAEVECATEETTRSHCDKMNKVDSSDPARHFTDSKVLFAHAETEELLTQKTDQCGNNARAFHLTEKVAQRWTALPLPTTETWINATNQDPDLKLLKTAFENERTSSRAQLTGKKHHTEFKHERLIVKEGIICQLKKPKATRIRQPQRKVAPPSFRATALAACHATPLAGHTGVCKTHWRTAARFWGPEMSKDIRKAVLECAHCKAANTASHRAQQRLGALTMDEPFDITMDVWHPGSALKNAAATRNQNSDISLQINRFR